MKLEDYGFHNFAQFLEKHEIDILAFSYIGNLLANNEGKGVTGNSYSNLLNLCNAFEHLESSGKHETWLLNNLTKLSTEKYDTREERTHIDSKVAAEFIAGGLLSHMFSELEPLVEEKGKKNPDFLLLDSTYLEVYCPQESVTNIEAVQEQHDKQSDKLISIAFSHPLTGQSQGAKAYPANKTIDRVLNHKRENDQTIPNSVNLLWLDLTHGFGVSSIDTQPIKTINHAGTTYTGSFGIWHAFYGKKDSSTFAPERVQLKYVDFNFGFYKQQKEGLFRVRRNLHGALILTKDGLVFFENPWSMTPLDESLKKKITQLDRFKVNYSWFNFGSQRIPMELIENELEKIEWLYERNS